MRPVVPEKPGIVSNNPADPNDRSLRESYTTVSAAYQLGDVCNMEVTSFDALSGAATLSFDPASGAADHTLYYGSLSNVAKWTCVIAMLLGRLEIFTLLVLVTPTFWRT